jgi:hypothetical protein
VEDRNGNKKLEKVHYFFSRAAASDDDEQWRKSRNFLSEVYALLRMLLSIDKQRVMTGSIAEDWCVSQLFAEQVRRQDVAEKRLKKRDLT